MAVSRWSRVLIFVAVLGATLLLVVALWANRNHRAASEDLVSLLALEDELTVLSPTETDWQTKLRRWLDDTESSRDQFSNLQAASAAAVNGEAALAAIHETHADLLDQLEQDHMLLMWAVFGGVFLVLAGAIARLVSVGRAQKNLVDKQALTESQLRDHDERLSLLALTASDGLWDWDLQENRIWFSERWYQLIGMKPKAELQSPDLWLDRVHADDVKKVREGLTVQIDPDKPRVELDYRLQHEDESWRWMQTKAHAVFDEKGVPRRLTGAQTDITYRKSMEEQLIQGAFRDSLTKLPNRSLFMQLLDIAFNRSQRLPDHGFALIGIDLDRFRLINESLGPAAGDELISLAARRIEMAMREGDTLARLGNDDFAILCEDFADASVVMAVAQDIVDRFRQPFELRGQEVSCTASAGVAFSRSIHRTMDETLREMDVALNLAKSHGGVQVQTYDPGKKLNPVRHLQMETQLRHAADRGELVLFFEPIMDIESSRVAGFEGLVRWNHPQRGLIMPSEFIPLAEESDLIVIIGEWVMLEACRRIRELESLSPKFADLSVNVNLSTHQFVRQSVADMVNRVLTETGLPPNRLQLEITESVIIQDLEAARVALGDLRQTGIRTAIDDFGTGYSSLSYLHLLPIDCLKVDRSFVNHMNEGRDHFEIVKTIIHLAHGLEMTVIAEGVETVEQLAHLRQLECQYAQGFLFSRAMNIETTRRFLQQILFSSHDPVASSS